MHEFPNIGLIKLHHQLNHFLLCNRMDPYKKLKLQLYTQHQCEGLLIRLHWMVWYSLYFRVQFYSTQLIIMTSIYRWELRWYTNLRIVLYRCIHKHQVRHKHFMVHRYAYNIFKIVLKKMIWKLLNESLADSITEILVF